MARPSCRDLVLDAAGAVVVEGGPNRMTLEAVAEKAGISKGGLLYHFPSKEALLEGMITRLLERSAERSKAAAAKLPEGPARELKGEILARLTGQETDRRVGTALLAAVANDSGTLATIRKFHEERFNALSRTGPPFERKALLLLATQGLFLLELLQVSPFTKTQRKAIIDELLTLADEVAATP